MLILKNITKDYVSGEETVHALNHVSVAFRQNEFVSILGPSGCGKTTLLNILGGLDRYTDGDLIINGRHTKNYRSRDWDTYRNHSIGFVFQSYNLIPHQTVLANVELALTISGVSKAERRQRAIDVLKKVGLGDQLRKKPAQMSGGQMQRVAIARALINNPEILLADEPTGALDTETSVQIMELLKEIAGDRLVIMVTHNPELAQQYSTRIVRLLDGRVVGDTNPYPMEEAKADGARAKAQYEADKSAKKKKPSMSFLTAMSLSFRNLMTKKARTILTSFAGSIGIIGIALILSISTGMNAYIASVEEETLSTFPIVIKNQVEDMDAMMSVMGDNADKNATIEEDKVYINQAMSNMLSSMMTQKENNLKAFRQYLLSLDEENQEKLGTVLYSYKTNFDVMRPVTTTNADGTQSRVVRDVSLSSVFGMMPGDIGGMTSMINMEDSMPLFQEMVYKENPDLIEAQYEVLEGRFPQAANEIVLVLDDRNAVSESLMYALNPHDFTDQQLGSMLMSTFRPNASVVEAPPLAFDKFLNMELTLMPEHVFFEKTGEVNGHAVWSDVRCMNEGKYTINAQSGKTLFDRTAFYDANKDQGISLKIVGVIRERPDVAATAISAPIAYTSELTDLLIEKSSGAEIVQQQKANPDINVFTGVAFPENTVDAMEDYTGNEETTSEDYLKNMTDPVAQEYARALLDSGKVLDFNFYLAAYFSQDYGAAYDMAGGLEKDTPSSITFIPRDFHNKQELKAVIEEYNRTRTVKADEITYTDTVAIIFSSVTTILDAITWVLVAFVAISLIVSSIMIGIITYISVLERTKEIGVLRSIGASKGDVARVFNAETILVGFISGLLGIFVTLLLLLPINAVIESIGGIAGMAFLPVPYGVGLIVISMLLTTIAGLFPAVVASKKDPVVALRTE